MAASSKAQTRTNSAAYRFVGSWHNHDRRRGCYNVLCCWAPRSKKFVRAGMLVGCSLTSGLFVDPFARRGDPFAGENYCGMAYRGDKFAVPARLDPQNTKPVLGVVKGNALDEARLNFLG